MSKKVKVSSDESHIYLEVRDISDCCFELWEISGKKESRVKIKIPVKSWEKILNNWKNKEVEKDDTLRSTI